MKTIHLTLFSLALFCLNPGLQAQWESTGIGTIPASHRIWSLKVASDGSVWAIITYDNFPPTNQIPKVLKSIDAGESWEIYAIPEAISNYGWDIAPVNSNVAYIALDNAGMYQTQDGGESWVQLDSYPYSCQMVHFFDEIDGVAIGLDQTDFIVISVTADGGNNWINMGGLTWMEPPGTSIPLFNPADIPFAVTFSVRSAYDYTDNAIIIGTQNGNYWLSTDRGYNWTVHNTPLEDDGILTSNIAMKDETTFMVAGDFLYPSFNLTNTVNYTTTDGGATWIEGHSGITAAATHYIPNTDSTFIMVGHNDFGFGSEGTAISYDLGANWDIINNQSLIAVDFLDEYTGYGGCCNNIWLTANGQIHRWNLFTPNAAGEIEKSSPLTILPNPVSTELIVDTNGFFQQGGQLTIEIIAINGVVQTTQTLPNTPILELAVSNLPAGFYTLRIQGERHQAIQKFMKQ